MTLNFHLDGHGHIFLVVGQHHTTSIVGDTVILVHSYCDLHISIDRENHGHIEHLLIDFVSARVKTNIIEFPKAEI